MKIVFFLCLLRIPPAVGGALHQPGEASPYHSEQRGSHSGNSRNNKAYWYPLALKGLAVAQFNIGFMYERGLEVEQDYEKAIRWYQLAAHQGWAEAQFHLARMYERGLGVRQNYRKAIRWYKKAAEQNLVKAQERIYRIGAKLNNRRIDSKNLRKCKSSFRKARKIRE